MFERFKLVAIAHDLEGWGNLCEFITAARITAPKGTYRVGWAQSDVASLRDCEILFVPLRTPGAMPDAAALGADVAQAARLFEAHLWIAAELANELDDDLWLAACSRRVRRPACRWWRPATCTCTCVRASRCRT